MSFLDAICCGFGAIILLFIVIRARASRRRLEQTERDLDGLIAQYEQELNEIVGETERVRAQRSYRRPTTCEPTRTRIEDLQSAARAHPRAGARDVEDSDADEGEQNRLASAKQTLTEEMRRLLADYRPPLEEYKVGGIPVDSEYIIFLIDTSGSMQQYQWDRVQQQLRETLEVYPTVKGIQVMNDEGEYMFKSYRDEWIPDTPTRRQAILDTLKNWAAVLELESARGHPRGDRQVLRPEQEDLAVRLQRRLPAGLDQPRRARDRSAQPRRRERQAPRAHPRRRVPGRVPDAGGELFTAANFATLMRIVCQRNGGTFVALPVIRDESRGATKTIDWRRVAYGDRRVTWRFEWLFRRITYAIEPRSWPCSSSSRSSCSSSTRATCGRRPSSGSPSSAQIAATTPGYTPERSIWVIIQDPEQQATIIIAIWALILAGMRFRELKAQRELLGAGYLHEGSRRRDPAERCARVLAHVRAAAAGASATPCCRACWPRR